MKVAEEKDFMRIEAGRDTYLLSMRRESEKTGRKKVRILINVTSRRVLFWGGRQINIKGSEEDLLKIYSYILVPSGLKTLQEQTGENPEEMFLRVTRIPETIKGSLMLYKAGLFDSLEEWKENLREQLQEMGAIAARTE